jgi:hypothetical protein
MQVMSKSKKIFVLVGVIFLMSLIYFSYDISSRTTFPGSKPQLPERLKKQFLKPDSVAKDTLSTTQR